jgi:hypothetical protein
MPKARPHARPPKRFEDSPIAWFGELLIAIGREDYPRAAESQRQLARLGWNVTRRKPRRSEGGAE